MPLHASTSWAAVLSLTLAGGAFAATPAPQPANPKAAHTTHAAGEAAAPVRQTKARHKGKKSGHKHAAGRSKRAGTATSAAKHPAVGAKPHPAANAGGSPARD